MSEPTQIGDCTLYHADCADILPSLHSVDAVVTDPPYGIKYDPRRSYARPRRPGARGRHRNALESVNSDRILGDDQPFDPKPWLGFQNVILWGANHFARDLPHGRWLAWNKLGDKEPWDDSGDVEFAWQNKRGTDRIFSHLWKGLCQKGSGTLREHPTQKPVELMKWCLSFVPDCRTILDPFMGSGTTGVACVKLGRKFIGIERERKYFDIACRRIEEAYRQPDMFVTAPEQKPTQANLFTDATRPEKTAIKPAISSRNQSGADF